MSVLVPVVYVTCTRSVPQSGALTALSMGLIPHRCSAPLVSPRFISKKVLPDICVAVIAAVEGRAHVHSEYSLLANAIVAGDGATFHDVPHFAGGIVPGDGIFTAWSYRAGAGRAEAFLLNPDPLGAQTAHEWGVIAEVVPNGKTLPRARELAKLYLKAPEVSRRNTPVHFIQPLKERIVGEVGYGLSLDGASAADLVKPMRAQNKPVAQKGKVA